MPDLSANSDDEKARRALDGVASRVGAGIKRAFDRAGAVHQRTMAKRFVGYGAGEPIQTRSGKLRRSFGWETRGEGLDQEVRLFSAGTSYARVQEYGATIRPKNKRYLTVPLPDALTRAGVLKGGARLVQRGKRWETADGRPSFIFRSRRGSLLIGDRAKNGDTRLLYVLKRQVTLRPRLGFFDVFKAQTLPFLRDELRRAAQKAVR